MQPDATLSITGRVSDTCEREINEQSVAVKTINPKFIGDSNAFKQVQSPGPPKHILLMLTSVGTRRGYSLTQSCGSDCDIRMLQLFLGSAPALRPFHWCTLGCLTGPYRSTSVSIPMRINSTWWVMIRSRQLFWVILILNGNQLSDVARGLAYLHYYNLVHGNLTGVRSSLALWRGALTIS